MVTSSIIPEVLEGLPGAFTQGIARVISRVASTVSPPVPQSPVVSLSSDSFQYQSKSV